MHEAVKAFIDGLRQPGQNNATTKAPAKIKSPALQNLRRKLRLRRSFGLLGKIETLPPEVRRYLLTLLDLAALRSLVYASPTFHQQYLFDRRYVLCSVLENTLGLHTVDAYGACVPMPCDRDPKQNRRGFLKWYGEEKSRRQLSTVQKLSREEASSIASLYFAFVAPLSERCALWSLDNLNEKLGDEPQQPQTVILSSTEIFRFTRAAYRFALLCNMTSPPLMSDCRRNTVLTWTGMLEQWEIEEVLIFYQFVESIYHDIFDRVSWDLDPYNPRFAKHAGPPSAMEAFHLSGVARLHRLEGAVLSGLPALYTLLNIKDHQQLVSKMQSHLAACAFPLNRLDAVFNEVNELQRRERNPPARDSLPDYHVLLPFRGEGERFPPRAWALLCDGTDSNLDGWYINDEMRSWGYVFWDQKTLEGTGADKLLKRQWASEWRGDDRRDT